MGGRRRGREVGEPTDRKLRATCRTLRTPRGPAASPCGRPGRVTTPAAGGPSRPDGRRAIFPAMSDSTPAVPRTDAALVRALGTWALAAGIVNVTIGGGIFRLPA